MKTVTISGWDTKIGKQAKSGWLAIASKDGIELREQGKTRKATLEAMELAIETEMENPWWESGVR